MQTLTQTSETLQGRHFIFFGHLFQAGPDEGAEPTDYHLSSVAKDDWFWYAGTYVWNVCVWVCVSGSVSKR